MRVLIMLLFLALTFACESPEEDLVPMKVIKKESLKSPNLCTYKLELIHYVYLIDKNYVVESCDSYNVSDTIYVPIYKLLN